MTNKPNSNNNRKAVDFFKKYKILIITLVVLVLLGGGYYLFLGRTSSKPIPLQTQVPEEVIPTISPSDLGLVATLRDDKKAIKFEITNIKDIASVDYQISYTKEVNGEQVPEGLIGEVKVKPQDQKISINYREFGTCSSGKCRYDKVVSSIKLTLKITKTDGKVYQAEQIVEL